VSNFDNPVLDGICPSWCDIQVRIAGIPGGSLIELGDISAIDSGWEVELGEQREGGRIIKRTRGSVTPEASMTVYASGYQKLLRGLRAQMPLRGNQRLVSLAHFNINIQFTPPGSDDILEYRIKGCRIGGRKIAAAEGNDAQQIEIPLRPIEVVDVLDGEEFTAV
jgi:hypothetical protein